MMNLTERFNSWLCGSAAHLFCGFEVLQLSGLGNQRPQTQLNILLTNPFFSSVNLDHNIFFTRRTPGQLIIIFYFISEKQHP